MDMYISLSFIILAAVFYTKEKYNLVVSVMFICNEVVSLYFLLTSS